MQTHSPSLQKWLKRCFIYIFFTLKETWKKNSTTKKLLANFFLHRMVRNIFWQEFHQIRARIYKKKDKQKNVISKFQAKFFFFQNRLTDWRGNILKGQSSGFRQSRGLIEDDCDVTGGIVLWQPDGKKKLLRRKSQTKFLEKYFRVNFF